MYSGPKVPIGLFQFGVGRNLSVLKNWRKKQIMYLIQKIQTKRPYVGSDKSEYLPSEDSGESNDEQSHYKDENLEESSEEEDIEAINVRSEHLNDEGTEGEDVSAEEDIPEQDVVLLWKEPTKNFKPRMKLPEKTEGVVQLNLTRECSELDVFLKIFPLSVFTHIADCTNKRIQQLRRTKNLKLNIQETDMHEIMIILGCTLVMSYNKVPSFSNYWSKNESMGNSVIKSAIGRDRCTFLMSKMYFTDPKRPDNSSKTYYVDDVLECLKIKFQAARTESSYQSIDESMVKFKGRSSLKQFIPNKPIKRGIKLWERCDSMTGYIYDLNIYAGKETTKREGTLGERVVKKLCETVRSPDVCCCFDRFFTSVDSMTRLEYPCVGTYMRNRKNVPEFENKKLSRGDTDFFVTDLRIMATRWQDTKQVLLLSNCHAPTVGKVERKLKTGEKCTFDCPEAVIFYNKYMGGVDLADQKVSTYDLDRKSTKWWRKVFYKLLMAAVTNSWILYSQLQSTRKKTPLLTYLVPLAEQLISLGRSKAKLKRKISGHVGRHSKKPKTMMNVGDHLPTQGPTKRRCYSCSKKKESRTKTLCLGCNLPLCKKCFLPFHS